MSPLMRRIAIHGILTAVFLGVLGLMLANMATIWISAAVAPRPGLKATPPDTSAMWFRLPLLMALSGFAIVAIGELMLHRIRKFRTALAAQQPPAPDQTEKLLNELIAREEAKAANSQGAVAPSAPSSENTTTPTAMPAEHSAA